MILSFINIRKVPREVLKTSGFALGYQHFPRDLANVNKWKIMFDTMTYIHCGRYTLQIALKSEQHCAHSITHYHKNESQNDHFLRMLSFVSSLSRKYLNVSCNRINVRRDNVVETRTRMIWYSISLIVFDMKCHRSYAV